MVLSHGTPSQLTANVMLQNSRIVRDYHSSEQIKLQLLVCYTLSIIEESLCMYR